VNFHVADLQQRLACTVTPSHLGGEEWRAPQLANLGTRRPTGIRR
jgi:hypothetical protein